MRLWRFKRKAARRRGRTGSAPLDDYLRGLSRLQVGTIEDTPLIAVDLELTGLDPTTDQIIAIGWTQLDGGRIQAGSNRHVLVQSDKTVGASAVIHGLVDSEVNSGSSLLSSLESLLATAQGRVWVFHHASLDTSFLRRACQQCLGGPMLFPVLDTLQIELALRKRRDIPIQKSDLQLGALRTHYQLPSYTAHNALIDAYATAELLLAMAARLDAQSPLKLKPYLNFF